MADNYGDLEKEVLEEAKQSLYEHDVYVDEPENIEVYEELGSIDNINIITKGGGFRKASYEPKQDKMHIYKSPAKAKAVNEVLEDEEYSSVKEKLSENDFSGTLGEKYLKFREADHELERMATVFDILREIKDEEYVEKLEESYKENLRPQVEHELLHKKDMDLVYDEKGGAKRISEMEDSLETYIKDIKLLGHTPEEKEKKYREAKKNGSITAEDIVKAKVIEKMEDYEELKDELGIHSVEEEYLEAAGQEGFIDDDEEYEKFEEIFREIEEEFESHLEIRYEEMKEEIDEYIRPIIDRFENAEKIPEDIGEARNQIWSLYSEGEVEDEDFREKLDKKLDNYSGSQDKKRYAEHLLDEYESTEGDQKEKIISVLEESERLIRQRTTEEFKQDLFKKLGDI